MSIAESADTYPSSVTSLLQLVSSHEDKMSRSFSLVPSENILSPLARAVMLSDAYSRYYFDDDRLWGKWAFHGGKFIGEIQERIVIPSLQRLARARHINVKSVSGLSNMIVALSTYCRPGDSVIVAPGQLGGHASTQVVAERLGLSVNFLPVLDGSNDLIDPEALGDLISATDTALIYVDQATCRFPLDIRTLVRMTQRADKDIPIHVDTSHINGLIFGGALENPLVQGATSFGGSFHKSFAGPHKAFIATNSDDVNRRMKEAAAHLVSHHHAGEMLALAVSLLEFEQCGGAAYARQVVENANEMAETLAAGGLSVPKRGSQWTSTHQVWVGSSDAMEGGLASDQLFDAGILVNAFGGLPSFPKGGLRIGLNEATKLGLERDGTRELGNLILEVVNGDSAGVASKVALLRQRHRQPKFCFDGMKEAVDRCLHHALIVQF